MLRSWEVLDGVDVDGVGGIFPNLFGFFSQSTREQGEFHSDPVCTDPVQNSPKKAETRPVAEYGPLRVHPISGCADWCK